MRVHLLLLHAVLMEHAWAFVPIQFPSSQFPSTHRIDSRRSAQLGRPVLIPAVGRTSSEQSTVRATAVPVVASPTGTPPEIPTIDISAFFRDDTAGRAAVGDEVRRACEGCGMFYITGHGLTDQEAARALDSTRALFRLSDEQKKALPSRIDNGFIRGFIGVGGESGSPTLFEAKVLASSLFALLCTHYFTLVLSRVLCNFGA